MKKLGKWLGKNKDIIGLVLHTIWLGASFGIKDMSQYQHLAGHGVISGWTGKGLHERYSRNKEKVDSAIKQAKDAVTGKNKKQN